MEEGKIDEFDIDVSGEIEDLRRYIEDFTSFLPLAFCMVNPLDYVLDCNKSMEEMSGYDKMEIIGNEISFLFKEKEVVKDFVSEVANKKGVTEKEVTLITKDSKEVLARVSALSRLDEEGNFTGYFLTITDITEAKMFEESLEKKIKERTKELESANRRLEESEAVLEIKINARTKELAELNESLEQKIQERTKELEQKATELEQKAQDMEQTQVALLNLAEDTEKASQEAEQEKEKTMMIIKNFVDGLLFFDTNTVLTLVNPKAEEIFDLKLRDIEGRTMKELSTFPTMKPIIDVIKKGEGGAFREEVAMENETYLEVTTISIKQDNKSAGTLVNIHDITREKGIERIKTEFVSVAAHQLRTPLAGIKWTLQTILEEEEDAAIPEEIMDFIRKAYEANDRMVNLVNDLLNVSRIEEGRYIYEPEDADFMDVISQIVDDYKGYIEKKGLVFEFIKTNKSLPRVLVDKEKIAMVIQNFLDNAMKYTKEGKIILNIDVVDNNIKVSVTDSGVGIPEDQQKRMFNKFFRAANVQRMDTEGSGLGLFIAKNIIEAHKGEVGFTSAYGEGSTFYFTIPGSKKDVDDLFKAF